jgi:hypothetical protein
MDLEKLTDAELARRLDVLIAEVGTVAAEQSRRLAIAGAHNGKPQLTPTTTAPAKPPSYIKSEVADLYVANC